MSKSQHGSIGDTHGSITEEIVCHFPYAIASVALSIIALSLLTYANAPIVGLRRLFHSFHYLHILFAATGSVYTFRKYSRSLVGGVLVGGMVPAVFCTLSDSIIPYLGGWYVGLNMHFHWCFVSHLSVVVPFLLIGMLNGFVVSVHGGKQFFYSAGFHFSHILISSLASILYLVGYGFHSWDHQLGFVFLFLIAAVLIPCTLSDLVIPMFFARLKPRKKR